MSTSALLHLNSYLLWRTFIGSIGFGVAKIARIVKKIFVPLCVVYYTQPQWIFVKFVHINDLKQGVIVSYFLNLIIIDKTKIKHSLRNNLQRV